MEVTGKLAGRLAQSIEQDIASGGYRVGDKLGTEELLSEQYNVSRTVLREALALVERDGLLHARRGKGGGLIVSEVTADNIAANLQRYLEFIGHDYEEMLDLRATVEGLISRLASQRLDEEQLAAMLALLEEHAAAASPQAQIAVTVKMIRCTEIAAKNPMAQVVSLLLSRQTLRHLAASGAIQQTITERTAEAQEDAREREALIRAIIAGDVGHGWQHIQRIMQIFRALISRPRTTGQTADTDAVLSLIGLEREWGLPHHIATRIKDRIITEKLGEGDNLGSEAALIAELNVGRGVLRSAVRLLEQLSVVKMVSGKSGGLRVLTPNPAAIIARSVNQLSALGAAWGDIEEVTEALAPLALERAMKGVAVDARSSLLEALAPLRCVEGASLRDLAALYHDSLSKLCAQTSPSLSFMFSLMGQLVRICPGRELENVRISGVEKLAFDALEEAMLAGKIELARRRLLLLPRVGFRFSVQTRSVRLEQDPETS